MDRSDSPLTVIRPSRGWVRLHLGEVWAYRDLLYFLIWRDLKVRYKQTAIGAGWAIAQPLMTMIVFSLFFGALAKIPSNGLPYPLFYYTALLPWTYFASSLQAATNAMVEHQRMITKVYFPRVLLPLAAVLSGLVDFGIAFVVLIGMMIHYGVALTSAAGTVPLFLLMAVLTALAVGVWLSALNAIYRDVRYAAPFLIQSWMFVSPVAYATNLVPEKWRWLYGLNPMAGVIEGFRWGLLGQERPSTTLWVSISAVVILLLGGVIYFRRIEGTVADLV
jgi:lipopolysaccharide transport system permease protein